MSALEDEMAFQIKAARLPVPEREYRFHPKRKWRFDFAWEGPKVALECEGGTWTGGAHVRGAKFEKDCNKYCEAVLSGWRVLRVTTDMVRRGEALAFVERALNTDRDMCG